MVINTLPNEQALKQVLARAEASLGSGGAPTYAAYGDLVLTSRRPLVRASDEFRGSYARNRNARRGAKTVDGTYTKRLSFEDLAINARYFLKTGGGTPVDDGETTHGYTRTVAANDGKLDSMAAEHHHEGMPFFATGIQFNETTISGDVDDAEADWNLASNVLAVSNDLKTTSSVTATDGSTTTIVVSTATWTTNEHAGKWVAARTGTAGNLQSIVEVLANNGTTLTLADALPAAVQSGDTFELSGKFTSGITDRDVDYISAEGTRLFIDDASADLGETEILDKLISWSFTIQHNIGRKRFQNNTNGYSKKRRRGERIITGQLVMEFDDWYEYQNWDQEYPPYRAIRIEKEGPVIDAGAGTHKLAQINVPRVQWEEINPNNQREGNITAVYQLLAYVDDDYGTEFDIVTKTGLATLP
jgi:hypothetical protein